MMDKTQKFWDQQAKRFDDGQKQFEPILQKIFAMTKEYLDINDNVLDFGCATGTKTLELADGVKHIHGLDFSAEMIKEAIKKKNKVSVHNVSFSQGTIFSNDLEIASFEKIIASSIIHLLADSEKIIQRIHDLLKPGGLFISTTPCFKDRMDFRTRLKFTIPFFMKKIGVFPLHLNTFSISELELLICSQNFNLIKAEKMFDGMTIDFIVVEKC